MPDLAIGSLDAGARALGDLSAWIRVVVAVGAALLVALTIQFVLLTRTGRRRGRG